MTPLSKKWGSTDPIDPVLQRSMHNAATSKLSVPISNFSNMMKQMSQTIGLQYISIFQVKNYAVITTAVVRAYNSG